MGDNDSIQVSAVKRIYAFLAGAALCNSIIAVFVASLAIVRLLSNQHNAFARSAAEMMLREVPLFFLAVRVHYVTAVFSYTAALAARFWLEFRYGAITVAFPQSPARCENLRSVFPGASVFLHRTGCLIVWVCCTLCVTSNSFPERPKAPASAPSSRCANDLTL